MKIFFAGGHAAADMPFLFVEFEDFFDFLIEAVVDFREPLRDILVDGAFADAEFFGRASDGRFGFHDVLSQCDAAIFHAVLQNPSHPFVLRC